jgi:hypothetical protein
MFCSSHGHYQGDYSDITCVSVDILVLYIMIKLLVKQLQNKIFIVISTITNLLHNGRLFAL